MIVPPGHPGVAFTTAEQGDMRRNPSDRAAVSRLLGTSAEWAWADQVHGSRVVRAHESGRQGEGDALFTSMHGLPLAVFTADCVGVALVADGGVGVAHAGWRGVAAGVVPALMGAMTAAGYRPVRVAIGPTIGPCCYEVGSKVATRFGGHVSETTWGAVSVDLPAAVAAQLTGVQVWQAGICTRCADGYHSHRLDQTTKRMATIAWQL